MRLRPRFRLLVPWSLDQVTDRLQRALEVDDAPCAGKVLTDFAVLRIRPDQQHYWSPELTLQLHSELEGGTLVRALFGPRPAVWTGFACFYVFALFVSLMALLFGLSQMSLGMSPLGLWLLPVPLALIVAAIATARFGQHLGSAQMSVLRQFLDQSLDIRD